VPAGVYAKKWLEGLGLWAQIQPKVVPTLDVRAALAAVESEGAPAGVVYRTDAAIAKKTRVAFEVTNGPRIVYVAAPLAGSKNRGAAEAFVKFLQGAASKAEFESGFLSSARANKWNLRRLDPAADAAGPPRSRRSSSCRSPSAWPGCWRGGPAPAARSPRRS
jgi:molybdate transport system substrate-binding protein